VIVVINIHGNEQIIFDLDDLEVANDDTFIEDKMDKAGGMSQAVHRAILNKGYVISYAGCGLSGWDLGVVLDSDTAEIFENFLLQKFKKAIEYEMIVVSSWVSDEDEDTSFN